MNQLQPMMCARQRHLLDTLPKGMWRRTVVNFVQSGYTWQDACRGAYMQLFHIVLPPATYKPTPATPTGVYVLRLAGDSAPGLTPLQAELASRMQDREQRQAIAREVEEIVTHTPIYRPQAIHLTPLNEPQASAPLALPGEEVRLASSPIPTPSKPLESVEPTDQYPALMALRHRA